MPTFFFTYLKISSHGIKFPIFQKKKQISVVPFFSPSNCWKYRTCFLFWQWNVRFCSQAYLFLHRSHWVGERYLSSSMERVWQWLILSCLAGDAIKLPREKNRMTTFIGRRGSCCSSISCNVSLRWNKGVNHTRQALLHKLLLLFYFGGSLQGEHCFRSLYCSSILGAVCRERYRSVNRGQWETDTLIDAVSDKPRKEGSTQCINRIETVRWL